MRSTIHRRLYRRSLRPCLVLPQLVVGSVGHDQLDAAFGEPLAQRVGVVGAVCDHALRLLPRTAFGSGDFDFSERGLRKRSFSRRGTFQPNSQWKTAAVDQYPPLRSLAPLGFPDRRAPFFAGAKLPSRNVSSHCSRPSPSSAPSSARQASSHTSCSSHCFKRRQQVAGRIPLPQLELHFTEWSSAYTATDPIHDQYVQAAFILEQVRDAASSVNSISYWTFTDIFEENGPPKTPFYGGFGLLNLQGIRKPAYFAYRYLAQLGETDLRTSDAHTWITKSTDGTLAALVWNYTPVVPPKGENDQTFYKREVPPTVLAPVTLSLHGIPTGDYILSVYRTGYEQNEVYDAYLKMGSPSQLSRPEIEELKSKSTGVPVEQARVAIRSGGEFQRKLPIHSTGIFFMTLTPIDHSHK